MSPSKEVSIIGGGVSGLGMAVQLKRLLGHDNFTIYEKSDNIGGTWWHNRYPGCACDIPSHFYPLSFALKPDWTTMYPGRDELHAYFVSVAEKYDIIPHCRFNAMCLGLVWDTTRSLWVCTFQDTTSGEIYKREAPVVVSAVGTLDRPFVPDIEGSDTFEGKTFHSASNGTSATQFVPELVKEVGPKGSVTQFIRSAHWWTKRGNPKYSEAFKMLMKHVPFAARIYRLLLAWELESMFFSFRMDANGSGMPQLRAGLQASGQHRYLPLFAPFATDAFDQGSGRKISRDHVITETGGRYPADAIIYATGFLTQEWLHPIKGIGGRDLHQVWDASGGAEAYKGTVVTGFPNFFILYGPNAATGQHSVIFHSECQINYSCRLLRKVLGGYADSIMVKPLAQERDLAWVHRKLQGLVFNSGRQSWWMGPRTKKNTFIYPDPMYLYWARTIFPRWSDLKCERARRDILLP
ncbi:hypothetical protein BDW68DRAFT_182580 [Aspergillus falconensis]